MKTKMYVAYCPCGCRASADFYPEDKTTMRNVKEWLDEGYTVRTEYHDRIGVQRCLRHELAFKLKRFMPKQGTVSVLVGCHSPVHSLIVLIAWVKLYHKWPAFWELCCIFLHDIGHWGKDYLDNYEEKQAHGVLGAKVAGKLFGKKGYHLCAGHNMYQGAPKSQLHDPDKYSWIIAPLWWMTSNAVFEPKLQRVGSTKRESAAMFKEAMRKNGETGWKEQGHAIYLKQWGHAVEKQN